MNSLLNFVSKFYIVFIIISAVLILALIGYIADKKTRSDIKIKNKKENLETDEVKTETQKEETQKQPEKL
ncbi:MAG: hypothetical protein ACI4XR_00160 [Bacilli bacterium]